MGPFPDKKLSRGVLEISTPAVAGHVRSNSPFFPQIMPSPALIIQGPELPGMGLSGAAVPQPPAMVSLVVHFLLQLFCPGTEEPTSTTRGSAYGIMLSGRV